MSCLFRIRESMNAYTETEKRLANYIINNPTEILHDSAEQCGKRVNTSAAAVVRFAKKIGYKGFTDMKLELARSKQSESLNFDEFIKEEDSFEIVMKKAYSSNIKTIEQTYHLLNSTDLKLAVEWLLKANRIFIFGVGASGVVCLDIMQKLARIGRSVFFQSDSHIQITYAANMKPNDVAIAISYSGKTKEIITATNAAHSNGAKVIAITQLNSNNLCKIADLVMRTPSEEKELRMGAISSRIASLALTDLLYFGVAKYHFNDTKDALLNTRNTIKEFE
ncbi:MAG: MurR/RpiR family transcriptional regulator [Erysipelotrichaceae bacterium]